MIVISSEDLKLIKLSYIQATKNSKNIFEYFYSNLFELDPSIKELFEKIDLNIQKIMLFDSITYFINVNQISDEYLNNYVNKLKIEHQNIKITPNQMNAFKNTLLDTIRFIYGDLYTDQINHIWTKIMDEIFIRFAE